MFVYLVVKHSVDTGEHVVQVHNRITVLSVKNDKLIYVPASSRMRNRYSIL